VNVEERTMIKHAHSAMNDFIWIPDLCCFDFEKCRMTINQVIAVDKLARTGWLPVLPKRFASLRD